MQQKCFLLFLFIALLAGIAFSITPKQYQNILKTGIDVDWVEFTKCSLSYINSNVNIPKLFKDRGFSHVRIRVKENLNSLIKGPNITTLQLLKKVVADSLKVGLIPIITYTANDFRENPCQHTLNESIQWWEIIAKNFKNYSDLLSYDLIIETSKKLSSNSTLLNEFYQKAIPMIRNIDKDRILFLTPSHVCDPYYLPQLWYPKDDKYIMIQWHFYAGGPSKKNKTKLWTTGTAYEKSLIVKKIEYAKEWCKTHGFYSWIGAWMPTNYNKKGSQKTLYDGAPFGGDYSLKEEKDFASFMAKSLKSFNIPFAINADTKFFDYDHYRFYDSVSEVLDSIFNA